ncbi:hypothetical protein VOLCADRAFT_100453 [Volvox carteri f. nagariensis]|uniref:Uncharacterized protein n=1 Tax=Volvox carteri f. nagariensis TaxID=3068 RepID=D8UK89_VOLCA|nr:uncharacterized protein VOLCADRAFT_100453 [Volvox carteri f. nagariensis]EFJ39862.1 hypothetical protein VOLCADRAFT_100453 [Volvox carteri f. nagariensis]|eukprot:XP_002959068.1 hypothetical protein VOLCADRAFT_100453 [Volvox carteri f. nagariensis]
MSYGLHGRILDSLEASYADVKVRVKLGNRLGPEFTRLGTIELNAFWGYSKPTAAGMAANAAKCEVLIFGGTTRERKRLMEAEYRVAEVLGCTKAQECSPQHVPSNYSQQLGGGPRSRSVLCVEIRKLPSRSYVCLFIIH